MLRSDDRVALMVFHELTDELWNGHTRPPQSFDGQPPGGLTVLLLRKAIIGQAVCEGTRRISEGPTYAEMAFSLSKSVILAADYRALSAATCGDGAWWSMCDVAREGRHGWRRSWQPGNRQMGSGVHRARHDYPAAIFAPVLSDPGAWSGECPACRRRPAGVEPLRVVSLRLNVPILAVEFYEKFGYDRPIHTLSHDMIFVGPIGTVLLKTGKLYLGDILKTPRMRSAPAISSVVFPGGDDDAMRPTLRQNTIDFAGRKGYVRTAIEAGVPIVPAVSISGEENQLYLIRGTGIAKLLGRIARAARAKIVPLSFGFPFGFSLFARLRDPTCRCPRRSSPRCWSR